MSTIFICYRREDTLKSASKLRDNLAASFSAESVFIDILDVPHGITDFNEFTCNKVSESKIFLVIFGNSWCRLMEQKNKNSKEDYVINEIQTAINTKKEILPILVKGAHMPDDSLLPAEVAQVTKMNAFRIRDFNLEDPRGYYRDIQELSGLIKCFLENNENENIVDIPPEQDMPLDEIPISSNQTKIDSFVYNHKETKTNASNDLTKNEEKAEVRPVEQDTKRKERSLLIPNTTSEDAQSQEDYQGTGEEHQTLQSNASIVDIVVPPSMLPSAHTSGRVVQWYKKAGDLVKLDDQLVEVSFGPKSVTVLASVSGRLKQICNENGTSFERNENIGTIYLTDIDETLLTRCYTCHTVFEVPNEILELRDSRVRCGECLRVFDVSENLHYSVTRSSNQKNQKDIKTTQTQLKRRNKKKHKQVGGMNVRSPLKQVSGSAAPTRKTKIFSPIKIIIGATILFIIFHFFGSTVERITSWTSCLIVGCQVEPDISLEAAQAEQKIVVVEQSIFNNPTLPDALTIVAILENVSDTTSVFPTLHISLEDKLGRIVAKNDFEPKIYLRENGLNENAVLESGESKRISIDVRDPGKHATSLSISIVDISRSKTNL